LRLSYDRLRWGECAAVIGSLISRDEKRAILAVKKGSVCPATEAGLLKDIFLQRNGDCEVGVELYGSAEDIKQGSPERSAFYLKAGCSPSQAQ
jgi:hypothetical protein